MSEDFASSLGRVRELTEQHKLFQANEVLQSLKQSLDAADNDQARGFRENELASAHNLIEALEFDVANCNELITLLDSDEGWELAEDKKGIQCFLKTDPSLPYTMVTLKGRCVMDCPVQNIVMQMNEIDLYDKWVPLVKEGTNLLEMSPFDKMMHVKFNFPLPISMVMSNRDLVFHGYVVDQTEKGAWVVNVRDARPEEETRMKRDFNFEAPPSPHKYVRVNLVNGGMVLRPLGRNKTSVQCMLSINPQLNLPTTIVNLLTRKFGYMFFETLNKRSCKLDKEYEERLDFELYAAIRRSVEAAFDA